MQFFNRMLVLCHKLFLFIHTMRHKQTKLCSIAFEVVSLFKKKDLLHFHVLEFHANFMPFSLRLGGDIYISFLLIGRMGRMRRVGRMGVLTELALELAHVWTQIQRRNYSLHLLRAACTM